MLTFPEKPAEQWADEMERLAGILGVRLGAPIYNCHQIPFDTSYPDYFPAQSGFAEFAKRLRADTIAIN